MSKSNPRGPWLPPSGTCSCCCPGSCQRWCGHYSGMFTSTSLLNLAIFNEFDLAFKTVRMQLRGTKGGALTVAFDCRKKLLPIFVIIPGCTPRVGAATNEGGGRWLCSPRQNVFTSVRNWKQSPVNLKKYIYQVPREVYRCVSWKSCEWLQWRLLKNLWGWLMKEERFAWFTVIFSTNVIAKVMQWNKMTIAVLVAS